jgi:endogenous inhibitor of DNA gyrase (YacG/DUF329 family)
MKKRTCAECGTHRFGLVRWRIAFKQFCSQLCKLRHEDRLRKEWEDNKRWFSYLARGSP